MSIRRSEKDRRRKNRSLKRQRRIEYRLRDRDWKQQDEPMLRASNIHYEIADRTRAVSAGGIGLIHRLARRLKLPEAIDERLDLLKVHLPYHESDHVLNIAYNLLAGGDCLEDIELRRNDESYLDALGAQRIPDPTTAGDFCRRFKPQDVETLMEAINETRLRAWSLQSDEFFDEAVIDADGTIAGTTGELKGGMDLSYKKIWGYHPLLISLANTQEPLFLVNRSGNRPSAEGAPERLDQAIDLCREAGFRKITVRGDSAFCQNEPLDRWDETGVRFVFSCAAYPNLLEEAQSLSEDAWSLLERRPKYEVTTEPRARRENVKERIVRERCYKNLRLQFEHIAELERTPRRDCEGTYRLIVLRKNLTIERGEHDIIPDIRYFFYLTNDWDTPAAEIVFESNNRCNQENLIEQLKNGVHAMRMPVDNLVSNWAYMVMASLAWSLKAWLGLVLPETGRWKEKYRREKTDVLRMEFKKFLAAFVTVPAQIVRTGRRIVYRLLSWNRHQSVFLRAVETLERPLLC